MENTKKCRYCGKQFSKQMRMCPFCGGEHRRAVSKKDPYCPVCNSKLKTKVYRGIEIDECCECEGIWLDMRDFKRVSSERDTYKDESISYDFRKKPRGKEGKYRPCVRCGTLMNKRHFKKISGVLIDVCNDHGVWLDKGELEQIRSFIANGGLEKYQEYLGNQIDFNHDKIRKISNEVNNVKFMQQMMNLYKPKYWFLKMLR